MDPDVEKLKDALKILRKENFDFQRYHRLLEQAIENVYNDNEKLLYSFQDRYSYFGELEAKSKKIELQIKYKMEEIKYLDIANSQFKNPNAEITDDVVNAIIRYTENDLHSLQEQALNAGRIESLEQMQMKEKELLDRNYKLQAEFEKLRRKVGPHELFDKYYQLSNNYLNSLRVLRSLQNQELTKKERSQASDNISNEHSASISKNKSKNGPADMSSASEFFSNVEKLKKEPAIFKNATSQTIYNMRTREYQKKFIKELRMKKIEEDKFEIQRKKLLLEEYISDIECLLVELQKAYEKSVEKASTFTNTCNFVNVNMVSRVERKDQDVETDEHYDYGELQKMVKDGKKTTYSSFALDNERFHLKTVLEQKVLEAKLSEMEFERKTSEYKAALKKFILLKPHRFNLGSQDINDPENVILEKKVQRYKQKIDLVVKRTEEINIETDKLEEKIRQVKVRFEILRREHALWQRPKTFAKHQLSNVCQQIALNQESIRSRIKRIAFAKMEADFFERVKDRYCKDTSQIDSLNENLKKLEKLLNKIKLRCMFENEPQHKYVITCPSEFALLEKDKSENEKNIHAYEQKIETYITKSLKLIKLLRAKNVRIPKIPTSCKTLRFDVKNIL